jgi:hypothetical protein
LKNKKTLSNWLTTKYLLIVRNEENLSEKSPFSFTYAKLIVFSFALMTVLLIFSLFLSKNILSQWFDPRHATLEANKQLLQLTLKIDSLSYEAERKQMFINTFKSILMEDFEGIDSAKARNPQIMNRGENIEGDELLPIDSLIRKEFEETGDLSEEHYGIDIVAKSDEPVKSIADGSVIMADWTMDSGYVIAIQHRNNLISVYKHNAALLKKVGTFVSAGQIIAIIGNTGELTTGPHLHFEIWYNGTPVNPEEFVSF